jgi:autotransporter translocation and assembly factor TamB
MEDKVFFDDNAVRVSTIGNASKMLVRGIVSIDHIRAELLKTGLAIVAISVRVNHAAYRSKIAGLELGDC